MNDLRPRLLLIDDDPDNLAALERLFGDKFISRAFTNPTLALQSLQTEAFSVILSDQRMPEMTGVDFLAETRKSHPLASRVLLTGFIEPDDILEAINRAEIYRYLLKPWNPKELLQVVTQASEHAMLRMENQFLLSRVEAKNRALEEKERELTKLNMELEKRVAARTAELNEAMQRLSELALIDPLTKILNRRAFFSKFQEELERTRRYRRPTSLAMIDVDHFKSYNDMEGHVRGDEALRKIAGFFQNNLRKTDILARYGGEEFVLLMPETPLEGAREICERLRSAIERTSFSGKEKEAYLTVSIGISLVPLTPTTPEEIVRMADMALYEAKQDGRNRIVVKEHFEA